jgi:abhydrolase domain-containing protein 6
MSRFPSFSEKSADLADGKLWYMEAGTGEPVLLLHGIFGMKEHWQALGVLLARSFRVIAPDLPMHGKSRSFGPGYAAPAAMARAVSQLATELGLARYHTAGNSLGAALAAVLGAVDAERVASVAFLGAPPVRSPVLSEVDRARAEGVNLLVPRTMEEFDRKISLLFSGKPSIQPDVLRNVAAEEIKHWQGNTELWNRVLGDFYFMEPYVERIVAPTLCIWGQDDRCNDSSGAMPLGARMKDCKVVVVAGAGHAVMQEDFRKIADLYLGFLRDHPVVAVA